MIEFNYQAPATIKITKTLIRKTLADVRDQLLSHEINGHKKRLDMEIVCDRDSNCGTAACIGGWASIFMLGFEAKTEREHSTVGNLFTTLSDFDRLLDKLFHSFGRTTNYNEPNIAATAIQRYLTGKDPWPRGEMPNVLPYTKPAPRAKAKAKAKRK